MVQDASSVRICVSIVPRQRDAASECRLEIRHHLREAVKSGEGPALPSRRESVCDGGVADSQTTVRVFVICCSNFREPLEWNCL